MSNLKEIMAYLCQNYPYKNELSNARLTKLIYLSDWFNCLVNGKQLTNIRWIFNHYGPYVDDIIDMARSENIFKIHEIRNHYGNGKIVIACDDYYKPLISENDKIILDFIMEKTKSMYFNEFIDYVYSTYPISSQERYANLNLVQLAEEYRFIIDREHP